MQVGFLLFWGVFQKRNELMNKLIYLLLFNILMTPTIKGATITVCASGCNETTISAAIATASSGDIIDIQDAIHTESNINITKNLTIQGQGQTTTTIQANTNQMDATDGVFKILTTGLTVIFKNITIQNGYAKTGGSSTLQNGGGVRINCDASTNVSFENVIITNNKCNGSRGGGIYITGSDGTVSFLNCVIDNNEAEGSSGDGGGIANLGASTFTMTKCTVNGNTAGDDGGGLYVLESGSTNKFINCTMSNNTAGVSSSDQARGGFAFLSDATAYHLYNCTIVENTVTTVGTRQGAGIYHTDGTMDIVNTIVANNSGATSGQDIYASGSTISQTTSLVENCTDGSGTCPLFSYFGDPNLSTVATCGVHSYFAATSRSFISDNGTAPSGDIPTDDICGMVRSAPYDIGAYDDGVTSTGLVSMTMDIEDYIGTIINHLPDEGTDDFGVPTSGNITTWETIIDNLVADNTTTANTNAATLDYEVILFTDNSVSPSQQYYLLQKTATGSNYWGTYVFNAAPCREIIIQAPHPIFDSNTGNQGAYCFKNTNARLFMLAGTHRCNQTGFSACSGMTTACSGGVAENFRTSDMAHNADNCFQATSNKIHDDITSAVIVQLHGFSKDASDPYAILSNGTTNTPSGTDYADNLKTTLAATDGTLTFKVGHIDAWTRLIGTTNTQGRYINGESTPCTNAASAATGRFVHLEQESTKLRNDATGWAKVSTALENLVSCVLPIELTTFKAIFDRNQIQLYWQTASEVNNYGFEIERSFDGKIWESISFIHGNNTTSDLSNYHFNDKKPLIGLNYYRLKQIDFDGQYEYSTTVVVQNKRDGKSLILSPNPVQNTLNIINGEGKATIYNLLGQRIKQFAIDSESFLMNVSDLVQGQYLLHIQKENGDIITKRFVK